MEDLDKNSARVRQITWVGIWVNLVLSVAKIFAGVIGDSRALIADGVESGMDIVTSMVLVVGSRFWSAPPDKDHPYGHRRIETIITLGIGLVVGLVGVSVVYNALVALKTGASGHPSAMALVVAIGTVLSKELLYRWSSREGRRIRSMSVVANAWHHRSDAISSIPVVVAVAASLVFPAWTFLDAVGALVAGGFILKACGEISWPALREIADTGADEKILARLRELSLQVDGVKSVHDLRTRFVGASIHVDLHIVVDPGISVLEGHGIGDRVVDRLKAEVSEVIDVLVHIDPDDAS